jgi:hypothetical protein
VAGNTVLYGSADPTAGVGVNGDFYINTTSHFIFGPKAGGAWPAGTSLIGPQGPIGNTGAVGPIGPTGLTGTTGTRGSLWYEGAGAPGTIAGVLANDNYLNVTNGDVYTYAGSSWGSPVGNIKGPSGAVPEAPSDSKYYTRRNGAWVDTSGAFVRFDAASALTAAQQQQARQNIYVPPYDSLGALGLQTNGWCDISQLYAGTLLTMANGGVLGSMDGWYVSYTHAAATAVVKTQRGGVGPPGSSAYLQLQATTALTAPATGDNALFAHPFEGYHWQKLSFGTASASAVTIGFWVFATIAGTFAVYLKNTANTRSYVTTLTVNAPTTWEFKTVTIPGCVDGVWNAAGATSATLGFSFVCGATYQTPSLNAWANGNYIGAAGQTNFLATANNLVCISGLFVCAGNEGPNATRSPYLQRPFEQEMTRCERYYEKSYGWDVVIGSNTLSGAEAVMGYSAATIQWVRTIHYKTRKRSGGNPNVFGYSTGNSPRWTDATAGTDVTASFDSAVDTGFRTIASLTAGAGASVGYFHWVCDARL